MQSRNILKVALLHQNARLPERSCATDVGLDLFVASVEKEHDNIYRVDFGIAVEPPAGFHTKLYALDSIHNFNTFVVGGVGIIDPEDRDSISMMIWMDDNTITPKIGDRFGRLVLERTWPVDVLRTELGVTGRKRSNRKSSNKTPKITPKAAPKVSTRYTIKDPETGASRPIFDEDEEISYLN